MKNIWIRMAGMVALLATSAAFADSVQISLQSQGLVGKSYPAILVHIQEPIAGFEIKLKRSDGEPFQVRGGGEPGVTRTLDLRQPTGHFHYEGELSVNLPDGERDAMPLSFDTDMFGPLSIAIERKDVDLEARKLAFRLSRPAKKAHVKVLMDTGEVALDADVPFSEPPPETPLNVNWPAASGRVMQITLRGYDAKDFFTEVEVSPWQLDIPHEEVNFDSGKFDVRPDQRARLDDSMKELRDAVKRFGRLANLKLYIAGHTDSVGDAASNKTLSLNRARAIGSYFRKKGLALPIFCEGFGEQALLVGTPDETDEPKNRRAEYILSIDPPSVRNSPFSPNWRKL